MVISCWVKGCNYKFNAEPKRSFFHIPKVRIHEGEQTREMSEERRRRWIANINRKDQPSHASRICSAHFLMGKPAYLFDKTNPDWAPTINMTDTVSPSKSTRKKKQTESEMKRYERSMGRQQQKDKHSAARALIELAIGCDTTEFTAVPLNLDPDLPVSNFHDRSECDENYYEREIEENRKHQSQTDTEVQRLISENIELKDQLNSYRFNEDSFKNNDDKVKYYTGLPSYIILTAVFDMIGKYLPKPRGNSDLGQFERLMMTLMRLKLNLTVQDLAYRFNTSAATVSRTFLMTIHALYVKLQPLLYWPDRDELRKTMPMDFRKNFGQKTAVIIDCFEVFIQRPKNLMARAQTWSSYKHNNTVKFLIGITPQGTVSFLSKAWGGRASDKCITENCGLLDHLLPGDLVLADRGFDIKESVGLCCAQLAIPAFTKGKSQLSPVDLETTRKIANVRIHVERVIGLVRNKYTMLQGRLPLDYLINNEGLPVIDKIGVVACALTNMCESVVPFN